jgi:hypothetical protein
MSDWDEEAEEMLFDALDALRAIEVEGKPARRHVDIIWRAIAKGVLNDEDTTKWARRIAGNVVEDVIENKSGQSERARRALAALELHDQGDTRHRERRILEEILMIQRLASKLNQLTGGEPIKISRRDLLRAMRAQGCYQGLPDNAALQRMDKL